MTEIEKLRLLAFWQFYSKVNRALKPYGDDDEICKYAYSDFLAAEQSLDYLTAKAKFEKGKKAVEFNE